jgi:hypothetical protein
MESGLFRHNFDSDPSVSDPLSHDTKQSADKDAKGRIRCRLCGEHITDTKQSINHNGGHIHYETNPEGYSFRFATYREAPGCIAVGVASFEHSWFNGYSWRIVVCNACGEHLGWLFSGKSRFYGLIIDKLLEQDNSIN